MVTHLYTPILYNKVSLPSCLLYHFFFLKTITVVYGVLTLSFIKLRLQSTYNLQTCSMQSSYLQLRKEEICIIAISSPLPSFLLLCISFDNAFYFPLGRQKLILSTSVLIFCKRRCLIVIIYIGCQQALHKLHLTQEHDCIHGNGQAALTIYLMAK